MKKLISVILTFAMLMSLAPAVLAANNTPRIPCTAPSPERLFLALNGLSTDEYGTLTTNPVYVPETAENGENITVGMLVEEDGVTLTEYAVNSIKEFLDFAEGDEMIADPSIYDGMEIPEDIYGLAGFMSEIIYTIVDAFLQSMAEYDESYAALYAELTAKYPNGAALHSKIMDKAFGDTLPSFEELLNFMFGSAVIISDDGVLMTKYTDYVYDKNGDPVYLSDAIAPTGAYMPAAGFSPARNVFLHIKEAYEAGELTAEQAFTAVTGYAPDAEGYLYTAIPEYNYLKDSRGNRIYDYLDILNEDGTVLDTEMTVLDYLAERSLMAYFDSMLADDSSSSAITGDLESEYANLMIGLLAAYLPNEGGSTGGIMGDDEYRAYIKGEMELDIAEMKDFGYSEKEMYEYLFGYYGMFIEDGFGYIASTSYGGYYTDKNGARLKLSDIMDGEGNFLTEEYGAETVWEFLEFYLKDMDDEALLKGDATLDGKINVVDVTAMLKTIAKWKDVDIDVVSADVTGDGTLNVADVTLSLKFIAGWDVRFVY